MREGLSRAALGLALGVLAVAVWGQSEVTYLNGVPYVFPSSQGAADENLTASDASGTLGWTEPPNSAGLSSGHVVLSTVACPDGWTRVSAADLIDSKEAVLQTGQSDRFLAKYLAYQLADISHANDTNVILGIEDRLGDSLSFLG